MRNRLTILLIMLCMLVPWGSSAQQLHTVHKKARAYWQKAYEAYRANNFGEAKNLLSKALERDSMFTEAHLLLADIEFSEKKPEGVVAALNKALRCPEPPVQTYWSRAEALRRLLRYREAEADMLHYLSLERNDQKRAVAQESLRAMQAEARIVANPVVFCLHNMGANINSESDEYWPCFSADEQLLVFTRMVGEGNAQQEDFYTATKTDSVWQVAVPMGQKMNTLGNEGAQSLAADGRTMVFTACGRKNGYGSCDLYVAYRNGNTWSEPVNIGPPVCGPAWESQPALTADGQGLFFVSNRSGGFGGMDIWYTQRNAAGKWATPRNVGGVINSSKNETAPFIHADGRSLYFASDGHPGMGKSDYFLSRYQDSVWSQALNLGYPINTPNEERGLTVNLKGDLAYLASARDSGMGGLDIYYFELPEDLRPQPVTFARGYVFDAHTNQQLHAEVQLFSLDSSYQTKLHSDPQTGEFLVALPQGKQYGLLVQCANYLSYSEHFDLADTHTAANPYYLRIPLQQLQKGSVTVLRNVFFEFDSWQLKHESFVELNKLVVFLNQNPDIRIEIGGHTDSQGTAEYNMKLSEQRAQSVANYLINKGIAPQRIVARGYGAQQPVATNQTDAGRQQNRRTELKIL